MQRNKHRNRIEESSTSQSSRRCEPARPSANPTAVHSPEFVDSSQLCIRWVVHLVVINVGDRYINERPSGRRAAATGAPPTSGTSMHGPNGVAGGAWVTVGAVGREGRRAAAISAPTRATAPRMG